MVAPLAFVALGGVAVAAAMAAAAEPKRELSSMQKAINIVRPETMRLIATFSSDELDDYPPPYSYQHSRNIAIWLVDISRQNAPYIRDTYIAIRDRLGPIDKSDMSDADKVLALIWHVIIPLLSYHLPWWWYRPKHDQKRQQLASVAMWLGLFFVGPQTSTANAGVAHATGLSSIPTFSLQPYAVTSKLLRGLSPIEQRRALLDVHYVLRSTICKAFSTRWNCDELAPQARARVTRIAERFDVSMAPEQIEEGNLKIVDELVWVSLMLNEAEIQAPDPEAMAWGMVINAIAVVLAAVAPAAGAALAGVATTAGSIASSTATAIGLSAAAAAELGSAVAAAVQAAVGAAVTWALTQTGVVDWLESSDELARVMGGEQARSAAKRALSIIRTEGLKLGV